MRSATSRTIASSVLRDGEIIEADDTVVVAGSDEAVNGFTEIAQ